MTEHFFEDRGIYYRTNEFGGDRETLILVHGLSGSSSAWLPYEKHFDERYNLISFDLRGHGRSKRYPAYEDYHFELFVEDIFALLAHLKVEKCIMVSHSFGSLIALDFLAEHQAMVKAAVLLSPNFSIPRRKIARILRPFLRLAQISIPSTKTPGGHVDYARYIGTGDWNLRRTIADVLNTGLHVYISCSNQSYAFDREDVLGRIAVPILLMHGRKDTIFPVENSILMSKKMPNAEIVVLENADHILVLNHFEEVSAAIDRFLDMTLSRS